LHNLVTDPVSYDLDLATISGGLQSVGILEFDIIPNGTTIQFEYIFASEEYPGYANPTSPYNDAMGLFISGPSISGTENIALLPITNDPVSVQNLNNGWDGSFAGPCNNCSSFICNYATFPVFHNPHLTYSGYSKILTATKSGLVC